MKLEDQVCSLELAKRLKELGVKQESIFWWTDYNEVLLGKDVSRKKGGTNKCTSAFTVAELGEMFPKFARSVKCGKTQDRWLCSYELADNHWTGAQEINEADARAKMLCHLIEKGIIDANSI